jgi:hypothetical protein
MDILFLSAIHLHDRATYTNFMDSLQDILARNMPQEPEEILAIKRYISKQFDVPASVGLYNETIVVTVPSAALANTLRLQLPRLQAAAGTTKRITFRIG